MFNFNKFKTDLERTVQKKVQCWWRSLYHYFFWNSTQCFSISSRDKMDKYTYLSGFITIHVYMIHLLHDINSWWFFELQLWSELLENKVKKWFLVLWLKTLVWFQYRSAKIFITRDEIHEALIINFIYKWNKVMYNTKSKFVLKKKIWLLLEFTSL